VQTSGLPANKCEVYNTLLGGGFGRRTTKRLRDHAVNVAKSMPARDKLINSREDA